MKTSEDIMSRKMSVYWLFLFLLNGINVYPGHNHKDFVRRAAAVYPWLICGFWMFINTSVGTSMVLRANSSEDAVEMLTYITGSSFTLAMFIIGLYKRPTLYRMLDIIRHEFWYDDHRPAADILFSRFMRTYGAIMPVATLIMCMTPVIWVANYHDINSPAAFIFRMWTPWTQLTIVQYAASYTVQFVVSLTVLISINGMVFTMLLIVIEMHVQKDILIDAVRELDVEYAYDDRDRAPEDAAASARFRAVRDGLVECVRHHQTLIAYFDHFKSYFNSVFIINIAYILVMMCLGVGSVLLVSGISAFHIKMLSLLVVVLSQFFFNCLIGEMFSTMNQQLGDCVYFKLVKCKDTKLARIGILLISRTRRPLQLSAMGMTNYSASLFTFAASMKTAYAGLNVLYNAAK